ncbi:MAG: M28 family peptidase, partial [Chloroflexi bacterium]|nr:M28 family peptidase [Chloroflexota bacterium]
PKAMILADMIGDADQQIYYDASSDPLLSKELFTLAAQLGYEKNFIPQLKYSMYDDHTPFLQRGIPSVDLIDFDYPYWHTTQDTADKLSAASLERVGRVIQAYIESR